MIVGIGVDVVDIARFGAALERTPSLRSRLFTEAEAVLPLESLAARFAAKEAMAKALGAPAGLSWHDCEVVRVDGRRPAFALRGTVADAAAALGATSWHLSLAHDGGLATAYVVLEG
ncbi:holo-ACP synthase [Nocardioides jiangxiensis]|uniref:Holo-[acyl-carrier-protein] synthase n=1 Tax=Nocardioides jiangxiensis TaxID=3064524 RepID=A0ABT9B1K0_9ACTN|nr:holo-ACP synthase [Nocardioides sp. WY-20]MDO7868719.1 holo-ACP synthase [Nocardioides sp. WY-20]